MGWVLGVAGAVLGGASGCTLHVHIAGKYYVGPGAGAADRSGQAAAAAEVEREEPVVLRLGADTGGTPAPQVTGGTPVPQGPHWPHGPHEERR